MSKSGNTRLGKKRGKYILHKENPTSFKKGLTPWSKGKGRKYEGDKECSFCHKTFHFKCASYKRANGYTCWALEPDTCSKECRYGASSIAQKGEMIKRKCIVCKKEFEVYPAWMRKSGFRGDYCSRVCKKKMVINYPEKVKYNARQLVRYLILQGTLKQLPCEVCGDIKTQAHHYKGYAPENWTQVKWLCFKHHQDEHSRLRRSGESQLL